MIIQTLCLGDCLITGLAVPSIDPADGMPIHYKSVWFDGPTDFCHVIHHADMVTMLEFLAAWARSDEDEAAHALIAPHFTGRAAKLFLP